MKSEYISRPTVQKMTGIFKEDLIDLLEREVIAAERQQDKSWKILRSSVEDYLKVHPKTHTHKSDTVAVFTAAKQIGCSKEHVMELIDSSVLVAYRDEKQLICVSCDSHDAYIQNHNK